MIGLENVNYTVVGMTKTLQVCIVTNSTLEKDLSLTLSATSIITIDGQEHYCMCYIHVTVYVCINEGAGFASLPHVLHECVQGKIILIWHMHLSKKPSPLPSFLCMYLAFFKSNQHIHVGIAMSILITWWPSKLGRIHCVCS